MFSIDERPKMRPSSFRDSGIIATPASRLRLGFRASCSPVARTASPFSDGAAPKIVRASSVRPAPTRPASPSISPARSSKLTPSTPGPYRSRTESATGASAGGGAFGGNVAVSGRPSIASISEASVSDAACAVFTSRPSRRTVTVSASWSTSLRKCEMRMIVVPEAASARTIVVEMARLARVERRGRLVHDDQLSVTRERTEDLDLLLLRGPQLLGRHVSAQVEACPSTSWA